MNETWPGMANANSCVYVPNCLKGNWPELHRETGEERGKERGRESRVQRPNQTVCGFVGLICSGRRKRVRWLRERERNAREHFERV